MNDTFVSIFMRRAVREYEADDVPDEILRELINTGIYAPSALNEQPWRFVVIKDRKLMKALSDRAKQLWLEQAKGRVNEGTKELIELASDPDYNIFYNAPVLVLIFSPPGADSPGFACAMAAENMMLAARSIDIGSCWIGMASILGSDKVRMTDIGVPDDYRLMSQLIFGYPVQKEMVAPDRNKDVILNWIK